MSDSISSLILWFAWGFAWNFNLYYSVGKGNRWLVSAFLGGQQWSPWRLVILFTLQLALTISACLAHHYESQLEIVLLLVSIRALLKRNTVLDDVVYSIVTNVLDLRKFELSKFKFIGFISFFTMYCTSYLPTGVMVWLWPVIALLTCCTYSFLETMLHSIFIRHVWPRRFCSQVIVIRDGMQRVVLVEARNQALGGCFGFVLNEPMYQNVIHIIRDHILPILHHRMQHVDPNIVLGEIIPSSVVYFGNVQEAIHKRPALAVILYELFVGNQASPAA